MQNVLLKAFSFVIIIALGYILKHFGLFKEHEKSVLTRLLMNVTMPCALLVSFAGSAGSGLPVYAGIGALCTLSPLMLNFLLTFRHAKQDRAFCMLNASGYNIGCFALPFVQTFFSADAVVTTCMFDAGNAVLVTGGSYTITNATLKLEKSNSALLVLKRLFSSVPFDTYVVILILSFAGITLPQPLLTVLDPIAKANAFVAMFLIGMMLHLTVPKAKKGLVVRVVSTRIVFSLIFSLIFFFCTPFALETRQTLCLLAFAPASALAPIFSEKAGCDAGLSSFVNSITILISIAAMLALILSTQG